MKICDYEQHLKIAELGMIGTLNLFVYPNIIEHLPVLGTILDGEQKKRWTLLSWSSLSNHKIP